MRKRRKGGGDGTSEDNDEEQEQKNIFGDANATRLSACLVARCPGRGRTTTTFDQY